MTPRIHQGLLLSSVLLLLTACGSNAPRQDDGFSSGLKDRQVTIVDVNGVETDPFSRRHDLADKSLAEVEALSTGMHGYQHELVLEIIRSLEPVPSGQLRTLIYEQNLDPEFTEWLELALQVRTLVIAETPGSMAAEHWANYHYGHVVDRGQFSELVASYREYFPAPSQVAILLPTEGSLSTAAKAIRDGIMSAYLDRPGNTSIRFYSSGEDSTAAITAYQRAAFDGAMHIIGPLSIESTRSIANLAEPSTPILLLNGINTGSLLSEEGGKPPDTDIVSSLSLSTMEEATAIAVKALAQGQQTAIMMVPESAWGRRIETAFTIAFEQGGGRVVAGSRFDTTARDHSAMLTHLLKIDASKQRKTDLQAWLGVTLKFEPSQRSDYEFIFLAANPAEGRELKPLLRFHDAGGVPVYAMGRIFSGQINRASDQDLNGIIFPTTRWQLQTPADTHLQSVRGGAYGNLYALGQDAWHLLPWLPLMQRDPDLWFPGQVGSLRLQTDGSFYREPVWAQFSGGRPTVYQWSPGESVRP